MIIKASALGWGYPWNLFGSSGELACALRRILGHFLDTVLTADDVTSLPCRGKMEAGLDSPQRQTEAYSQPEGPELLLQIKGPCPLSVRFEDLKRITSHRLLQKPL